MHALSISTEMMEKYLANVKDTSTEYPDLVEIIRAILTIYCEGDVHEELDSIYIALHLRTDYIAIPVGFPISSNNRIIHARFKCELECFVRRLQFHFLSEVDIGKLPYLKITLVEPVNSFTKMLKQSELEQWKGQYPELPWEILSKFSQ